MARSYWTKTVPADRGREPSDLNEIGRTGSFESRSVGSRSNGVGRPAGPSGARVAGMLAGDGVRGGGASASTFPALKRGPEKSGSYQNDAEEMARSMARRRRRKTSPFLVGVEDGDDGLGSRTVSVFGCDRRHMRGLNRCARGWGSEGEPRWRSRSSVLTALVKKSGGNGGDGGLDSEQPGGGEVGFWGGFRRRPRVV